MEWRFIYGERAQILWLFSEFQIEYYRRRESGRRN